MSSSDKEWIDLLDHLGFNKVKFPIIIKDGQDLEVVKSLKDFALDSDYFLFPNDNDRMLSLIDSTGNEWTWKYDYANRTNLPGKLKWPRGTDELKQIILTYFVTSKQKEEVASSIEKVLDIEELINILGEKS